MMVTGSLLQFFCKWKRQSAAAKNTDDDSSEDELNRRDVGAKKTKQWAELY